jgi:hypothetical protein
VRIFFTAAGSVMVAITRILPAHIGQRNASTPYVRRSSTVDARGRCVQLPFEDAAPVRDREDRRIIRGDGHRTPSARWAQRRQLPARSRLPSQRRCRRCGCSRRGVCCDIVRTGLRRGAPRHRGRHCVRRAGVGLVAVRLRLLLAPRYAYGGFGVTSARHGERAAKTPTWKKISIRGAGHLGADTDLKRSYDINRERSHPGRSLARQRPLSANISETPAAWKFTEQGDG